MNKKFNHEAATKIINSMLDAMKVADELSPGYTRHSKLPSVIKQTEGWEVDEKQLEQFEKVVDLLVCAIFGVDCDGDRSLKWAFINRHKEETILPSFVVPRVDFDDASEEAYWNQLYAIQANLHAWQEMLDKTMRLFAEEREKTARARVRLERAKGCDVCKETGFKKASYREQTEYKEKRITNERFLPTGVIDCPKCQQPALIEAKKNLLGE